MIDIAISSDNHLEFVGKKFQHIIKMKADVLCLAGDICACGNKSDYDIFVEYIQYLSAKFKYIIHVAGNHEYYTAGERKISKWNTMEEINKRLRNINKIIPNYIFLNCESVMLNVRGNPYVFIGATLWSKIDTKDYKRVENAMNDYNYIYQLKNGIPVKFTVKEMQKLFEKNVEYIKKAVHKYKNYPCVVITHHKPIRDTKEADLLTQAYETDITKILGNGNVKYAFHGHTHKHYNKVISGIRYISNPKGYKGQRTNYIDDLIVRIK